MEKIKLSQFTIKALKNTIKRVNISDEEYFGPAYKHYISNSRLSLLNPQQGGSPQSYLEGFKGETTSSLVLGSAVHQLFLQLDEFTLVEGLHKPSAKLGLVVDRIKHYRNEGASIYDAIVNSSKDIEYYTNSLTANRIKKVIKEGLYYYLNSRNLNTSHIVLSDQDVEKCKYCVGSLCDSKRILNTFYPTDISGDPIEHHNEETLLLDIEVFYKNTSIILPLKLKIDNWNIDEEESVLRLNDLKTTGRPLQYFMEDSFVKYHYDRQLALYGWALKQYCEKEYSYNKEWTFKTSVAAVETVPPHSCKLYSIGENRIKKGHKEFTKLLKMVAYYELFGYDKEAKFV